MVEVIAFADESGTSKGCPCYTIGVLTVPKDYLSEFNDLVDGLFSRSGIHGEIKWQKIRKSAGKINLCLNLAKLILESPCTYHCIVVHKQLYRKWHIDEEEAFFTTYDYLLSHSLRTKGDGIHVKMDQKSTSYKKQDEVVKIITNHLLGKKQTGAQIKNLSMEDSKEHLGLQAVDILTGAVNTGHWLYLDETAEVDLAKKIACKRIALTLGWSKLIHDTLPSDTFNIWHFPTEYRAFPSTQRISPNLAVQSVTREQYENWAKIYS